MSFYYYFNFVPFYEDGNSMFLSTSPSPSPSFYPSPPHPHPSGCCGTNFLILIENPLLHSIRSRPHARQYTREQLASLQYPGPMRCGSSESDEKDKAVSGLSGNKLNNRSRALQVTRAFRELIKWQVSHVVVHQT